MTGEALWEIFRKHLRQIETEGEDLARLVKEVRQIRDQLISVLSDAGKTQEEIKDWFREIQKISANSETGSMPARPTGFIPEEKIGGIEKLTDEIKSAADKIGTAERESRAALEERIRRLENRLQACEDQGTRMRKQTDDLNSSLESVRETVRLLEDFFDRIYNKLTSQPEENNAAGYPTREDVQNS